MSSCMLLMSSVGLALGMLVDNGIVVVENVYRLMDEGYSPLKAARYGVGEVAWPIIASTGTTLAAFLPLALWPGLIGEFMSYLPMTLIIVLGSSLFVALLINPVLTAVFMKVGAESVNRRRTHMVSAILLGVGAAFLAMGATGLGNILAIAGILTLLNTYVLYPATLAFQNAFLPRLEALYERFLSYVLGGKRPWAFFWGTVGLLFLSIVLMGVFPPKVLFFPDNQPQYLNIFVSKPIGTDLAETNKVAKDIEVQVMEVLAATSSSAPIRRRASLRAFWSTQSLARWATEPATPTRVRNWAPRLTRHALSSTLSSSKTAVDWPQAMC